MKSEILIIILYIAAMVAIGIISNRKSRDMKQFVLGGRKAGAWMSAFAYGTAYFSAVVFIGYAGRNGWNFGLWVVLVGLGNAIIGSYLAWKVLAKRTRIVTNRFQLSTMPEFFNARYQDSKMRTLAAVIIFVFMTPYAASAFSGLSYLFESVFGIDYTWAIFIMAGVAGAYLTLGGYVAALLADFIQGMIMLVGLVLMLGCVFQNPSIGGLGAGMQSMIEQATQIPITDFSQPNNLLSLISLVLLTSVGTWALPQMVHRFYAIKSDDAVKKGTIVSTGFAVIISVGAYLTGAIAKLFFTVNPSQLPMEGGAVVLDRIIPDFLTATLPGLLLGVVIVLVLSASVTTLSSITLVSSSSMTLDLIKPHKKNMSPKGELITTRLLCVLFLVIAVVIALTKSPIQMLMSFSWGTVSGSFIGPYILGLYWKGTTRAGARAGMCTGLIVSLGLAVASGFNAGNSPLYGVLAMIGSLLMTWFVSLFTKKFDQKHVDAMLDYTETTTIAK